MKLLELIQSLDATRVEELAARWHIAIDRRKLLTPAEQVARGLVLVPRWLDQARLGDGARESLRLLAAAPRGLARSALPESVDALVEQGFVYAEPGRPERLVMPAAFRLQIPASPSDSPRAARLLVASVPDEPRRELCQFHLQRLPPLPWAMLLEPVLERLEDAAWVKGELVKLAENERALLSAVDGLGGEVRAEEVLELSREPVRIAHGGTVQVPRRSAIFALARRGLVIARQEGWVIPDEVERIVGRERRARAGLERQRLLMSRHMLELTPSRAELAVAPGIVAVALLAELSSTDQLPTERRGVSKVAVRKVAQQLFIGAERAELLACLARAEGLWYATSPIAMASERLWSAWLKGGAWDEAAREPDLFRPGHPMSAKATALIREALLDTLALLPASEFALSADVLATTCTDRRALAAQRGLALAARAGQDVLAGVPEVANALLEGSLPYLGLVDVGKVDEGPVVRLSQRARSWLEDPAAAEQESAPERAAHWLDDLRLVCGPRCSIAAVVEAARYGRVWLDDAGVGIELTAESLARGADHDPDLAGLRGALSALSDGIPAPLARAIDQAAAQRPLFHLARVGGFLAIDDAALRAALYEDAEGPNVFAAPPLSEGLLVRAGISESRVQSLLMRHGARLFRDPQRQRGG